MTLAFVLALQGFIRWPPDAFTVDRDQRNKVQTLYWIQGDAIGQLTAEGDDDSPTITGALRSLGEIETVYVGAKIIDNRDFGPGEVRRAITVRFRSGDEIKVDVASYANQHLRDRANEFINEILSAAAGDDLSDDDDAG